MKVGNLVKIIRQHSKWSQQVGLIVKVQGSRLKGEPLKDVYVKVMLTSQYTSWFNVDHCEVLNESR
jgi:hypothetical protein